MSRGNIEKAFRCFRDGFNDLIFSRAFFFSLFSSTTINSLSVYLFPRSPSSSFSFSFLDDDRLSVYLFTRSPVSSPQVRPTHGGPVPHVRP
jgi:hypothetical protein